MNKSGLIASTLEVRKHAKEIPQLAPTAASQHSNDCRFLTNQIVKERNRRVCPPVLRGQRVRLAKGHVSIGEECVNSRTENFFDAKNF